MTPCPRRASGWAPQQPRLAWPAVLLAHAALLAGWQLGPQHPGRPPQPDPGGAVVWARPLTDSTPPAPPQRKLAAAPPVADRASPRPQARAPLRPAAASLSAPPTRNAAATPAEPIPWPAPRSPADPQPAGDPPGGTGTAHPAAPAPAPLNLALPAQPGRAASRPPSAWATQDPRLPAPPSASARLANTLGTDTRLRSSTLNDGARRWQSGRHCVETRPARDSQINPFDAAARRLPQLAQGC